MGIPWSNMCTRHPTGHNLINMDSHKLEQYLITLIPCVLFKPTLYYFQFHLIRFWLFSLLVQLTLMSEFKHISIIFPTHLTSFFQSLLQSTGESVKHLSTLMMLAMMILQHIVFTVNGPEKRKNPVCSMWWNRKMCSTYVLPTNLQQLCDATIVTWTKISGECFQHLCLKYGTKN